MTALPFESFKKFDWPDGSRQKQREKAAENVNLKAHDVTLSHTARIFMSVDRCHINKRYVAI